MIKLDVDTILHKKNKTRYWLFNQLNLIAPMSYTNYINMLENRTQSIKYANLYKICTILDCTPNDILLFTKKNTRR